MHALMLMSGQRKVGGVKSRIKRWMVQCTCIQMQLNFHEERRST